jgi:urea carboxylase-associated protein 1
VDVEGQQAVDFLCYNARNPSERYNAADTMKYAGTVRLTKGHSLYSDMGRALFRIIEDTCGSNDTIFGCCSAESNWVRYGVKDTPNCRDNFLRALRAFGLGRKDLVPNVNFFMSIPIDADGHSEIRAGPSKAGDFVDIVAERDTLAVVSNCPQTLNAANNFRSKPIRILVWQPRRRQRVPGRRRQSRLRV